MKIIIGIPAFNEEKNIGPIVAKLKKKYDQGGSFSVFSFCAILMTLWVGFAFSMKAPPAIKTLMFMIKDKSLLKSPKQLAIVQQQLKKIKGVRDVIILPEEGKVMLKVNKHETIHETLIIRLLGGKHGVS